MQLTGFQKRLALVTGAGGGIGGALVRLLREAGAEVVATDVSLQQLDELQSLDGVHCLALNVSQAQQVDELVTRVEADIGAIDHCVNLAGVLRTGLAVDASEQDWDDLFAVNAKGVFNVSRRVAQAMRERRGGNIVTVSSNAAGVPRHGMAAYAASKAAASMFTRSLGLELAEYGIRCNIVAPGSTLTQMQTGMWRGPEGESQVIAGSLASYKNGIPLGRIAQPEDVAQSVLFLLSEQSRHITMADLYVDGGATQRA